MRELKVLVIDDDEDDYFIVKHYLNKIKTQKFDVYWINDFDQAGEEILKNEHDIYLIDHFLGKGEGIEIIEKVRSYGFYKPLILLTGAGNQEVDRKAMEKGASDYLVKTDLKIDLLERTLRYAYERYHQQRYIKEQERKYKSLFELSREPLLILDKDFNIIEYNNTFQQLFEFGEKAPTNLPFKDFFSYDFDFDILSEKVLKQGFIRGFKTNFQYREDSLTVIISVARLNANSVSEKAEFQVAISDVSQLIEAQKQIQQMEKLSMTGRMARMIAHEVRNPLTNINLAVGELEEITQKVPEASLYLEMVGRNAERISKLIDDLLQSAKPAKLEMTNAIMQEVLDSAIEACKDRISLQGVHFKKIYPEDPIEGRWDPEKLKIAFVNIIINAVEAMKEKDEAKLELFLTKEQEKPTIYIKDNGCGMDEDTANKIFDPFFTNRNDGLGLGMTATLNIVAMHNGKISVNSKKNVGTEFKVVLDE